MKIYSKRRGAKTPPSDAVYVGRPTKFGNPFIVGQDGAQGECVNLYADWINRPEQSDLREAARKELRGKDLVCWCKQHPDDPTPCHAEPLMEIANG